MAGEVMYRPLLLPGITCQSGGALLLSRRPRAGQPPFALACPGALGTAAGSGLGAVARLIDRARGSRPQKMRQRSRALI